MSKDIIVDNAFDQLIRASLNDALQAALKSQALEPLPTPPLTSYQRWHRRLNKLLVIFGIRPQEVPQSTIHPNSWSHGRV